MQFNLVSILVVGAGGFVGAASRFMLSISIDNYFKETQFPLGIAITNILGCLIIGFSAGLFAEKGWMSSEMRLFLFTGLLGGFTTFSTFVNDTFLLWQEGHIGFSLLNAGGQVMLGLFFVWIGYSLVKLIF